MTKRTNRRKNKPVKKPAYTKLDGYKLVSRAIKEAGKSMANVAHIVNQYVNVDKSTLTTGKILKGNDAVKLLSANANEIKTRHEALIHGLDAVLAAPGKRDESDFAELVGQTMEFLNLFGEYVVMPMADIAEAIEGTPSSEEKETVNV